MALRDIKKNKAYVARQQGASVIPPAISPTWAKLVWEWKQWSSASPDWFYDNMESLQNADTNTAIFTWGRASAKSTNTVSPTISTKSSPYNNAWAWYKSNVSKNWWITVKKDLWYDLTDFGDVNTIGNKYKWQGYKIPTFWENIDFTKVPQLWEAGQEFDRFGKQAELMEAQTPWFLNKRNDAYLAELARTNPDFNTLDEASQKQAISNLLQQRDVKGELFSWSKWQQDVLNTINSIYNRIWQWKSQNQILNEKATQLYDKEQGNIDSMYQAEKNNFLKAGAVEDRFTNFNEVESKIQNTLLAAGQHRADNLYTGTPNDAQIAEIAQWLWQDFATTKKILEGRGYEDLQLQDEFNKEASQGYDRNMQDLEVNKQRAEEDADLQHQRTQAVLDQQIEDTKLQMQQDLAMWEKAGALSGAVRSSWYMQWLDSIKSQYMKNIGRLQERQARDTADTIQNKKRISEVYELNATRNKEDLNNTLKSIKMSAWLEMSQYLNEFAPSSTELERKLNDITNKYGLLSQDAFAKYNENIRGITDTMTYDTEKIMELQQKKQTLQQVTVWKLLADNGMALAGLSKNDLQTMVQNGTISNTDYSAMTGYMKSLGIATLQSKWVPTQEDISLYTSLLDSWVSPQQAITTVMSKSPNRYTGTKDQFMTVWSGSQVFDTTTGQFISAPWTTGWTQASYTWPTIPPATHEKLNVSFSKYTNMKNGTVVRWWQCGMFVNDYIKEATGIWNNMFVDPINIRKTQINRDKSDPVVGSVIVMTSSGTPNATEYWHVGIVTWINADWSINIKDQNWKIKGAVGTQTIPANDPKIVGFFDPQLWLSKSQVWQTSNINTIMEAFDTINFEKPTLQKQQKETIQRLVDTGKEDQAKLKLINLTTQWLSAESKKTFEASRSMVSSLWQIQETLAKLKAKWVNTWLLTGKYEEIANKFGKVWDKEIARLGTTLRDQLDALRRSRSGAALTAFEEEFYNRLFPSEGKSYDLNEQAIRGLQDSRNMLVRSEVESVYWPEYADYLLSASQSQIQKNVAPAQTLLNTQLQQAQAKKWNTTTQPTTNKNTTIKTLYNMYWL